MRRRSFEARKKKLLAEEATHSESWWWLSFAGDDGFRGGVLTRARGFVSAVQKTHDLGINPGGEVQGVEIPGDVPANHAENADRLLSRKDIDEKLGGARKMNE